jgi:LPXTG-motif cell wall-anchored protein
VKKLIIALATVAFIGIGGSAVSAEVPNQLPPGCTEPSDIPTDPCWDETLYPLEVEPPTTTAPTTTVAVTTPPGDLPRTGSGVSPILGIGALLLIGGGIVVVASRRRSSAAPTN